MTASARGWGKKKIDFFIFLSRASRLLSEFALAVARSPIIKKKNKATSVFRLQSLSPNFIL